MWQKYEKFKVFSLEGQKKRGLETGSVTNESNWLFFWLQVVPKEKITITERGLQIKVPAILNPEDTLTLNIFTSDVIKVRNVGTYTDRLHSVQYKPYLLNSLSVDFTVSSSTIGER